MHAMARQLASQPSQASRQYMAAQNTINQNLAHCTQTDRLMRRLLIPIDHGVHVMQLNGVGGASANFNEMKITISLEINRIRVRLNSSAFDCGAARNIIIKAREILAAFCEN